MNAIALAPVDPDSEDCRTRHAEHLVGVVLAACAQSRIRTPLGAYWLALADWYDRRLAWSRTGTGTPPAAPTVPAELLVDMPISEGGRP